jgi:hypothetical protein
MLHPIQSRQPTLLQVLVWEHCEFVGGSPRSTSALHLAASVQLIESVSPLKEEFYRLPWLGQSGRAAAGCACTAAALRC